MLADSAILSRSAPFAEDRFETQATSGLALPETHVGRGQRPHELSQLTIAQQLDLAPFGLI